MADQSKTPAARGVALTEDAAWKIAVERMGTVQPTFRCDPYIELVNGADVIELLTALLASGAVQADGADDFDCGDGLPRLPTPIEVGGEGWTWGDFVSEKTFTGEHMFAYAREAVRAVLAAAQAGMATLPDRHVILPNDDPVDAARAAGWNACRDEVLRLNAAAQAGGAGEVVDGMTDREAALFDIEYANGFRAGGIANDTGDESALAAMSDRIKQARRVLKDPTAAHPTPSSDGFDTAAGLANFKAHVDASAGAATPQAGEQQDEQEAGRAAYEQYLGGPDDLRRRACTPWNDLSQSERGEWDAAARHRNAITSAQPTAMEGGEK